MDSNDFVTLKGCIKDTFPRLDPKTIRHADEIWEERYAQIGTKGLHNSDIANKWFFTADGLVYRVENGKPFLYISRGKDNIFFKNFHDALGSYTSSSRNYYPQTQDEIIQMIEADKTERIDLSNLRLYSNKGESQLLFIRANDYGKLNKDERLLAECGYGREEKFPLIMEMLCEANRSTTAIKVLTPGYVKEKTPKDSAIVRIALLKGISCDSDFVADYHYVFYDNLHIRGRLLEDTIKKEVNKTDKPNGEYIEYFI